MKLFHTIAVISTQLTEVNGGMVWIIICLKTNQNISNIICHSVTTQK